MRRKATSLILVTVLATPLAGQEWRVGAQFGRVDYASAVSSAGGTTSLSLGVSRTGVLDWFGASIGIPIADVPFWAVTGAWKRWRMHSPAGLGVDALAHGFVQRGEESATGLPPFETALDRNGAGVGGEVAVVGFAGLGRSARLEARGGLMAQTSRVSGIGQTAAIPFADGRVLLEAGPVQVGPEAKLWFGDTAHSFLGASAYGSAGSVDVWLNAGQWLAGGTGGFSWSAGAMLPINAALRLEAAYRSPDFDPLYGTQTSRSVTLGLSLRVAGSNAVGAPVPASYENGRALIRVRRQDVLGRPRIAGDFNDWKPQPMTAAGDSWTFSIPLKPGVYNYAFVNERGEWFVPDSVPGKRDDGMGGHVAVLVVS